MLSPLSDENTLLNLLCSNIVSKILPAKAYAQYSQGAISKEFLLPHVKRIKEISASYTEFNAPAELSIADAESYALYYLPINFIKVLRALSHCRIDSTKQISMLDFGAGPGTASLAAKANFKNIAAITQIEKSLSMQKVSQKLSEHNINYSSGLESSSGQFDLIICANSINELNFANAGKVLIQLISRLKEEGVLMLLEPALLKITRDMMKLRDILLSHISVIYPCTHNNFCPLLQNEKEWCHTELDWQRPLLTRQLDELLGFNKHKLKTSLFIFKKGGSPIQGERVINFPVKRKYGKETMLCGPNGLRNYTAPKQRKDIENYSLIENND